MTHSPFCWPTILPTWCGHTTTAPIPAGPGLPQCVQLRARLNDGPGSAPTRWRICQPHQAAGRVWSRPRYAVLETLTVLWQKCCGSLPHDDCDDGDDVPALQRI